jgi:tungstate transport system ATP-binding protein
MPMFDALLPASISGLTFEAGGRRLIDDAHLKLQQGAITMIIGPNGAGKSLLLRLLHGLIEPSAGDIQWGTRAPDKGIQERQAMVFQRPVMLRRSVAANIDFALKLRGEKNTDARDRILSTVGLQDRAKQPARLLSGGEQQRLSLARALATEPSVLFLDEPTAHLDPASTAAIEDVVRDTHHAGTKIVFVSHDIGQVRRLADEVIFMHRGRILEQTPATHFFQKPRSQEAKHFLSGELVF